MSMEKHDIRSFMRSLPILAGILGRKLGVKIQIGGSACTDGKTIYLPPLPLDGGEELFILANGFIDHEAAHVRDTDFDALVAARLSPLAHHLFNIVEDVRVERELAGVYPGCQEHFKKMYREMLKGAEAGDNTVGGFSITGWLMSSIFSEQYPDVGFPVELFRKAVDDQFPNLITQLEQFIQPALDCDSTQDSIAWGETVESFLYQYFERSKQQKKEQSPQSPEGGPAVESSEGDAESSAPNKGDDECKQEDNGSDNGSDLTDQADEHDDRPDVASAEDSSEAQAQPDAKKSARPDSLIGEDSEDVNASQSDVSKPSEPLESESLSSGEEGQAGEQTTAPHNGGTEPGTDIPQPSLDGQGEESGDGDAVQNTDAPHVDEAEQSHGEAEPDSGEQRYGADTEDGLGEESQSGSIHDYEQQFLGSSGKGNEPVQDRTEDGTEAGGEASGSQGGLATCGSGSGTAPDISDSNTSHEQENGEGRDGGEDTLGINGDLKSERLGNDTAPSLDTSGVDMLDKIIQGDVSEELSEEARESLGAMVNSEGEMPRTLGDLLKKILERFSQESWGGDCLQVAVVKGELPGEMPKSLIEDAQSATKVLATRLSGLLQTQTLTRSHTGRRGRIDGNRLHRLAAQNPRVFQRSAEKQSIDTAVHILLDCSSSMTECMPLANAACYSVASALHRIRGVSVGVTAFPGIWDYEETNTVSPVLKHGQRMHMRFAAKAYGSTPMGEALWWTCQQMMALKENRKIILILTDGVPDSARNTEAALEAAKGLGYEVIGIGIGQYGDFILTLIENSRVIKDIQELAPAMFGVLQQALTERGQ